MELNDVFKPDGLLKQKFPQYKIRESQVKMATLVSQSIQEKVSAVIEGATGVGKGFAYLIPTIVLGEKAIISTSNKSLQDQLDRKDLPALQEVFGHSISWTVLKGKNNYFCNEHFQTNEQEIRVEILKDKNIDLNEAELIIEKIGKWASEDETGDLEYCYLDLPARVKELIACDNDTQHTKESEGAQHCFANKARVRAHNSQIVLVNHTLLAIDISLRNESDDKAGILPMVDVIIIDEAHEFEKQAVLAFSDEISLRSLLHLLNWSVVKGTVTQKQRSSLINNFTNVLNNYLPKKNGRYYEQQKVEKFEGLGIIVDGIESVIQEVKSVEAMDEGSVSKIKEVIKEAEHLQDRIKAISQPDENMLRWSEAKDSARGETYVSLKTVPLDISDMLRDGLFAKKTVICTSATLSVNNGFEFFRQQVGMPVEGHELIVESPFNFKEQALVYIPDGENDKIWETTELLKLSKGRAFVLCTSYNDMRDAYEHVQTEYPKLIQGQNGWTRAQVLEAFRNTPNAVLFATKSFWEGVDVQGEQLSLVVIWKTPFENPYDLIFSSKCEKIDEKEGKRGASFIKLAVPDACIKLKQGVGRLIRSSTDTGVIALLDSRVLFKSYGGYILNALPPAYRTQKLEKVQAFFNKINKDG